tara:strand:+ start:1382 stop:1783 length:402 start_codon:yes stop_codon:yes gene_type:complete
MNYKDRMVDTAITILAKMYNVPEEQLRKVGSRKRQIMEARRLLIFYLNRFIGIKHLHMKQYIKGLCHATSIHHCNKMEWFILYDIESRAAYDDFQEKMQLFDIRSEIIKDKQQRVVRLQAEIKDYIKQTEKHD